MLMVALKQDFPAGRAAQARAGQAAAKSEAATALERAWRLSGEIQHAFIDYWAALELRRSHDTHHAEAHRLVEVSRARLAAGAALADVALAEREMALIQVEVTTADRSVARARVALNTLLLRAPEAPLGIPVEPRWPPRTPVVTSSLERRPDWRVAASRKQAAAAMTDAELTRARQPSWSAGVFYFAPTGMGEHAFGLSAAASLPWLWGGPSARALAARHGQAAAEAEWRATQARARQEVAVARLTLDERIRRGQALSTVALPAARRAADMTLAAYVVGKGELLAYVMARGSVIDLEVALVMARTEVAHGWVDYFTALGQNSTGATGHDE
jgi:outer membrane protein TolC